VTCWVECLDQRKKFYNIDTDLFYNFRGFTFLTEKSVKNDFCITALKLVICKWFLEFTAVNFDKSVKNGKATDSSSTLLR
jgi:hypothetical protein